MEEVEEGVDERWRKRLKEEERQVLLWKGRPWEYACPREEALRRWRNP